MNNCISGQLLRENEFLRKGNLPISYYRSMIYIKSSSGRRDMTSRMLRRSVAGKDRL